MNTSPSTNAIDIIALIAGIIGTLTGIAALIWNFINHLKFILDIYSCSLSARYKEKASKIVIKLEEKLSGKDLSNYSDNAIVFNGQFRLLLRREALTYRNHRISLITVESRRKLKKILKNILADKTLSITLFCENKHDYPELSAGLPVEINAHSNPEFLKKDWRDHADNPDQIEEKLNTLLMDKKNYKINIQLTTYKYPLCYVKGSGNYFRREFFIKKITDRLIGLFYNIYRLIFRKN